MGDFKTGTLLKFIGFESEGDTTGLVLELDEGEGYARIKWADEPEAKIWPIGTCFDEIESGAWEIVN